jgi:VIT1/CCC1 family predicted Fe2+/Mn2+ transporter
MAIADGLSDAVSLHTVEEAEVEKGKIKHSQMEIWLMTFVTFFVACGFTMSFVIPVLLFEQRNAVFVSTGWGMILLVLLNLYIAKIRKENPKKLILEHILLAIFVIIISHLAGDLIAKVVNKA